MTGFTMRILVTNDDGIDSPGLHALSSRLARDASVTVFAPSGNMSGASAAIGHIGPGLPDVMAVDRPELGDVDAAYCTDAPPGLAVLLACAGIFGEPPDAVVSGINPGWNVGQAVHFSGTIGACITARVYDVPGIAVSQVSARAGEPQRWETAAEVAASLVAEVDGAPRVWNVNVPNLPDDELGGTRFTGLSDRVPYGLHSPTLTPKGGGRYGADFVRFGPYDNSDGTDTHAVEHGFVSVTELISTRGGVG